MVSEGKTLNLPQPPTPTPPPFVRQRLDTSTIDGNFLDFRNPTSTVNPDFYIENPDFRSYRNLGLSN